MGRLVELLNSEHFSPQAPRCSTLLNGTHETFSTQIENVYGKVDIVAQSFVYGDSFQHQLVAIVVPDLEAIPTFCKAHDLPVDTPEALCKYALRADRAARSPRGQEAASISRATATESWRLESCSLTSAKERWNLIQPPCPFLSSIPDSTANLRNPDFIKAVHVEMDTARKEAKLFGFEHAAKIYLDPTPFSVDNDLLTPTFKLKRDIAKKYYQAQIDEMYDSLEGVAGAKGLKQTQ